MTTARVLIGSIGAALVVAATTASAETRAVVELFTSQGCSSCPAADKVLAELRNDQTVVPLTLSIDYWDYLGWKDTLAIPGHTNRQKAYSQMRGDREVYTPQVVVNGVVQALGSDRAEIEKAVALSHDKKETLTVPVAVAIADDRVAVTLPNGSGEPISGEVWLCPLSRTVQVVIGRGENRGRTITYTNVVRRWVKLGIWSGKSETLTVPVDAIKSAGVDGIAVLLQEGNTQHPGPMLGATVASIH
jgi:hypothetical protein